MQRDVGVLPWLWGAAGEAAEGAAGGAAIGMGALGAGALAGLAVLLWPNNSIVSGSEEHQMLLRARLSAIRRTLRDMITELQNSLAVPLTAEEVEKYRGRVEGAIAAIEDFIRSNPRQLMRCANELGAFRAAAQAARDYLAQPLDQINKVRLIRLYQELEAALAALLACMGAVSPDDGGPATG